MPADPRDAPEYVRVPVSTLVDYRALLSTVESLRADVLALRGVVDGHIATEKPTHDLAHNYLSRLADEETTAAARAVAAQRTADETAAATRSRLGAIVLQAVAILATALVSGLAVYFGASP